MQRDDAHDSSARSGVRWTGLTAEGVVSLAAAALLTVLCTNIQVDPLQRIGQVSALASIGLRYALIALALIAVLVIAARVRGGAGFDPSARLVCAAIAGMATGMIAGGIVVALRGTPWGLNGRAGDAGALIRWVDAVRDGGRLPPIYPPLPLYVIGWYADLLDLPSGHALKHMQIIGTAVLGPAAYVSWRLVLRPAWALGIGLIASLPLIDGAPYRPYAVMVLMVFIPMMVWFFGTLRRAAESSSPTLVRQGAVFGAGIGILCLTYSGWFQWSAPGVLLALLVLFPWRGGARKGLVLCGFAGATFAAIAGRYVIGMLTDPTGIVDKYVYFDVLVDPAYIAMYRGDLPGSVGMWPPLGELGGVGLFTAMMAAGLGLSIALGRARTLVIAVGSILAGAWLLRFYYAHYMWKTKLVQLYPRTTPEILYCLLILGGYALYLATERLRARSEAGARGTPSSLIGAVCGLILLFASTGSAISDHYMPNNGQPYSPGWLAWVSHQVPP